MASFDSYSTGYGTQNDFFFFSTKSIFSINGTEMITQSTLYDSRLFGNEEKKRRIWWINRTPPKGRGYASTYITQSTSDNNAHLIT